MSVAATTPAPPQPANGIKPPRPLSPNAKIAYTIGLYLAMALFAVAVCGLMIVADVENTSYLSHTTLGARVRPLLTRKPFLVGGFFNTGAFGAVMAYARLHEHQRYLEDEEEKKKDAKPKSRQERRKAEADRSKELSKTRRLVEESMRAVGAKVFVEKGGKLN